MRIEAFAPGPLARNAFNRWRRNLKRRRNRRFYPHLRRADERQRVREEIAWAEKVAEECRCLPPHQCPCESALYGFFCEERGHEPDYDQDEEEFDL